MPAQSPVRPSVELVLRIAGEDRPGLVEILSQVINDHQGSWIDSSMARLGGEFAGIVQISVSGDQVAAIRAALAALESQGIKVSVGRGTAKAVSGDRARLDLTGLDHPGIVHEISLALARHKVSIDELHTQVFAGSMTGAQHFAAKAVIVLPEGLSAQQLSAELEKIASDMMVEIELRDVEQA